MFSTAPVMVICEFSLLPLITPSSVCAIFKVTLLSVSFVKVSSEFAGFPAESVTATTALI